MEFVYVVPRSELFPECAPHGFRPFDDSVGQDRKGQEIRRSDFGRIASEHGFYVERARAEQSPEWKQIIPYVVVVRTAASGQAEVFTLRRLKAGGEKRLHDKLSIGVGGHINPVDSTVVVSEAPTGSGEAGDQILRADPIKAACKRELHEELILESDLNPTALGLLNDDTNPVGAVHLGLVEIVHVDGPVSVRETDQLEGSFTSLEDLMKMLKEGAPFETWSALLIPCLHSLLESNAHGGQPASSELQPTPIAST